jgi:isocitrate lyase
MAIVIICSYCGNEFTCWPSKACKAKFCSKKCKDLSRVKVKKTYNCIYCNNVVSVVPYIAKKRKGFCSRTCFNNSKRKTKDGDTHRQCTGCSELLSLSAFRFRKNKNTYYSECNECAKLRNKKRSYNFSCRYKLLLNQAKKRKIEVNLSIDDYLKLIDSNCYYCKKSLPKCGVGLDRIHNDLGYTIDNVVPCCSRCNTTRNENFTHQEMVILSKTIMRLDRLKSYDDDIIRPYSKSAVEKLRGSFNLDCNIAFDSSMKLREMLRKEPYLHALGCLTGLQAVQCAKAGLKSIYVSGWQIAADQNLMGETYPDQSLYPCNSGPILVGRINKALKRANQIDYIEGCSKTDYNIPIIADCEASFGGPLNAFELMKAMIEAGAAGVHFEDQLASAKKCGHLGGKVLIPTSHFIKTLVAARLASDVLNVPTIIIARTDAYSARLLTSDIDEADRPFIKQNYICEDFGEYVSCRTKEGHYEITGGLDMAIARGLAYAPYADLIWCETSTPNYEDAKKFAEAIHEKYPHRMLSYNCSPSFNWKKHLNEKQIFDFQKELGQLGYRFQFVTLAGFHALNQGMFDLALEYNKRDMEAYVDLQEKEFDLQADGYTATKHQREVGTGYFDLVMETIGSSLVALKESTEKEQF